MATQLLGAYLSDRFPDGTTINVYPADSYITGQNIVPSGAALFSGTFSGTSGLSVTGLTANARYVANGAGQSVRFTAAPTVPAVINSPWKSTVAARRSALGFT